MYELGAAILSDIVAQTTTVAAASDLRPIGAALAIGLGGIGPGIGIGIAANGALQAIGRNPEAVGALQLNLIIGAGLAEAVAIYALLIGLLILFVL